MKNYSYKILLKQNSIIKQQEEFNLLLLFSYNLFFLADKKGRY